MKKFLPVFCILQFQIRNVHAYQTAGHYIVNLTAVNNVSQAMYSLNVTVQNPVLGLSMWATTPAAQWRNNSITIEFFIHFNSSLCDNCLLPSETFKNYSFGTTNCSNSQRLSGLDKCVSTNNYAPTNYSLLWDDMDSCLYADPGTYQVTLNVSNFVSFMSWNLTVDVDTVGVP